jgi:hypothetical protein
MSTRKTILDDINRRANAQIPAKPNALEAFALTNNDNVHEFGRWFVGRDKYGNDLIRSRNAGIIPALCPYKRPMLNYEIGTNPHFCFQYPTERSHRKFYMPIDMYR